MNELTNTGGLAGLATLLIIVGRLFKSVPAFPDNWIPTALALIGCGVALAVSGVTLSNAIEGLAAGLAAVGANQVYRQHKNNNHETPPNPIIGGSSTDT